MSSSAGAGLPPWDDAPLVTIAHLKADQVRRAAVHVADHVAGEHPHLTAQQIAADPLLRAGLRELLDQLGLTRRSA